jgi:hypothetical protein
LFNDLKPIKLRVTGGISSTGVRVGSPVHRRDLAAVLQRVMGERRLKIASGLPLKDTLMKELGAFRYAAPPPETEYNPRGGEADDLVLAVACTVYAAERGITARPIHYNLTKWGGVRS